MEAFRIFLSKASHLASYRPLTEPLRLVMGNVSVDMDSVVGSMVLAYYYFLKYDQVYVPVINCTRDFFPMKLDIN